MQTSLQSVSSASQSVEQAFTQANTSIVSQFIPAINSASVALSQLSTLFGLGSGSGGVSGSSAGGHAVGGYISGTSTSDSIPAMLSNGEFVVRADSVKKYGLNFLNAVNSGSFGNIHVNMPKLAKGGVVSDGIEGTARGMTEFAKGIGTNVSTTNKLNVALVKDQDEAMEHFMRSGVGQKIMLDFTRNNASFIGKVSRGY